MFRKRPPAPANRKASAEKASAEAEAPPVPEGGMQAANESAYEPASAEAEATAPDMSSSPHVSTDTLAGNAPTAEPQEPRPRRVRRPLGALARVSRVRPWVWWASGGLLLLALGLAGSWFLLPVRQVQVTGNSHLSEAEVRRLAGLSGQMGWLYYGKGQARGLLRSPWVQSAVVTRKFPDTVTIELTERKPFLKATQPNGSLDAVSQDGQLLPGATGVEKLPSVTGWGPSRLPEAVLVARALSRYTVESVAFTPSGVTVKTAQGTVWSGDPKSLVKYAGSISMYPNQKINIYPWGVSVQ